MKYEFKKNNCHLFPFYELNGQIHVWFYTFEYIFLLVTRHASAA